MQLTSVKPPSIQVQEKFGTHFSALGAKLVDASDAASVEVRFADPKTTTVANAAFEGTLDGVKLLFTDSKGNGVRGIADGYSVLDAVAKLPGVTNVAALESLPMQLRVTTDSAASKAAVDALLRPATAHGEPIGIE